MLFAAESDDGLRPLKNIAVIARAFKSSAHGDGRLMLASLPKNFLFATGLDVNGMKYRRLGKR